MSHEEERSASQSLESGPEDIDPTDHASSTGGSQFASALRQQVAQSLQPVLSDFRRDAQRAIREELERAHQPPATSDKTTSLSGTDREEPPEPRKEHAGEGKLQGGPGRIVHSALDKSREALRGDGSALQSVVNKGVDALFSESVRSAVERQLDQGLRAMLQMLIDALPGDTVEVALRREADDTLHSVMEDTLHTLFEGPSRAEVQAHAEAAAMGLERAELSVAQQEAEQAFQALLDGILDSLQHHWEEVLRVLFPLMLEGLEGAVRSAAEQQVGESRREVEGTAASFEKNVRNKAEEGRRKMAEATERLRNRIQEAVPSASGSGNRNEMRTGRPPSGRPPSGRPPSGRPPSGRPPSALQR